MPFLVIGEMRAVCRRSLSPYNHYAMAQGQPQKSRKLAQLPAKRKRSPFGWGDDEYLSGVSSHFQTVLGSAVTMTRLPRD